MRTRCSAAIALAAAATLAAPAVADTTWDRVLTNKRFEVLKAFNNEAVLDKETGLLWEQSPSTNTSTWSDAISRCYTLRIGGRRGWRLPTIEELSSLEDASQFDPALPAGHPFSDVWSGYYWSSTTFAPSNNGAWVGVFGDQDPGLGGSFIHFWDKAQHWHSWCVRGGQGIDGVQ